MTRQLALCVFLAYMFVLVVATSTRESVMTLYDRARAGKAPERQVGYGQVRFRGAGPEKWAARYRRERQLVASLTHTLSARTTRLVYLVTAFTCVHGYEGAWNANTGNGYFGGLQFGSFEWTRFGGIFAPRADLATPAEQIAAGIAYHDTGAGFAPWPNTARRCGLIP
jgi:hypothetical protein